MLGERQVDTPCFLRDFASDDGKIKFFDRARLERLLKARARLGCPRE